VRGRGRSRETGQQYSAEEKKLRQHYLELAMQTFRQAQASGFTDVIFMDHDPDLDPIRGMPAFEEWRESFRKSLAKTKK
jgi:hypothetical protein